jgi:GT2 family glycosyltransferase
MNVRLINSARGLAHQRNVGLSHANGEIVCFLDDDVTIEPSFLERVAALLKRADMQEVGGVTGYDVLGYPQSPNLRWKLRRLLRIVPALVPGNIDRFARSIPISFSPAFHGCKDVGYFYGFCMIFRTAAIRGLRFDEELPTYGGEDRDFSRRAGRRTRLVMCGDLELKHHCSPVARDSAVARTYQAGFGIGRGFGKTAPGWREYVIFAHCLAGEVIVDSLSWLQRPSRAGFQMVRLRAKGFLDGIRSCRPTVLAGGGLLDRKELP